MKLDRVRITIVRLSAIGDCIHGLPVLCASAMRCPRTPELGRRGTDRGLSAAASGDRPVDPGSAQVAQVAAHGLAAPSRAASNKARHNDRPARPDEKRDRRPALRREDAHWFRRHRRPRDQPLVEQPPASSHEQRTSSTGTWSSWAAQSAEATGSLRPAGVRRRRCDDWTIPSRARPGFGQFAVINPGAGWPSPRWPIESFTEVARYLGETYRLPSVVTWAGQEEQGWAAAIAATAGGHAHVAPTTTLAELAALCRRARFFFGSDTGPLHLAVAVGTPCIGMYGPVDARRTAHMAVVTSSFSASS